MSIFSLVVSNSSPLLLASPRPHLASKPRGFSLPSCWRMCRPQTFSMRPTATAQSASQKHFPRHSLNAKVQVPRIRKAQLIECHHCGPNFLASRSSCKRPFKIFASNFLPRMTYTTAAPHWENLSCWIFPPLNASYVVQTVLGSFPYFVPKVSRQGSF